MSYKDRETDRKYRQDYYQKNKDVSRLNLKQRRQERAKWFVSLKSKLKCANCPEDHPACLDFHHKDEDKFMGVGEMVSLAYSEDRILAEIAKCVVYCSNCHRKHHWGDFKNDFILDELANDYHSAGASPESGPRQWQCLYDAKVKSGSDSLACLGIAAAC